MADNQSTRDIVPGFGAAVRARRLAAGMTTTDLATTVGTHQSHVSRLELEVRSPSLRMAVDIAEALGVTLQTLLTEAKKIGDGPVAPAVKKPKTKG